MSLSEWPPLDLGESAVDDTALLHLLRLHLVNGIGPRHSQRLLDRFGSAQAVFDASLAQLEEVEGIGPKVALSIAAAKLGRDAEIELAESRELGVKLLRRGSAEYPPAIERICDPPLLLYCRGNIQPQDELAVAIVGSRRCTVYGRQQAEKFASALARAGVTIVSGLARGIDAAAHHGALAAGGRTIAVMGTGLAEIYPPEHRELAEQVVAHGALLSEFKLHQVAHAGHFPQRNRIISGLSVAVVVVEASKSSGALHTARHAMEQGKEVLAVPGRIDSLASEGCHDLIRDGATLVRHVDDILAAIGPLTKPVKVSADRSETVHSLRELSLNEIERQVLNLIGADPTLQDEIIARSQMEPPRVLSTLTVLEMKRLIRRQPGGFFIRSPW
jgi:DNA processing protein